MKNILIIDDSALMRRIISDIINSDEELHSERTATNGLEAINMLESDQRFDCIILDINMPKMNGIEFLKTMNRKGIKQNVIIVSTSQRRVQRRLLKHWNLVHSTLSQNRTALLKQRVLNFQTDL